MSTVPFYVPLCPGERMLLEHIGNSNKQGSSIANSKESRQTPFELWAWTLAIKEILEEYLELESFEVEAGSDIDVAYRLILNSIAHFDKPLAQSTFRAQLIEDSNPIFLKLYRGRSFKDIQIKPCSKDKEAWVILESSQLSNAFAYLHDLDRSRSKGFNIWNLFRIEKVLVENERSKNIFESLVKTPEFQELYAFDLFEESMEGISDDNLSEESEAGVADGIDLEVLALNIRRSHQDQKRPTIPGIEDLEKVSRAIDDLDLTGPAWGLLDLQSLRKVPKWPMNKSRENENGDISLEYLRWLYLVKSASEHLPNPFSLIHFLRWDDLGSERSLEKNFKSEVSQEMIDISAALDKQWWTWKPGDSVSVWMHSFHPEEEIYWHCIENNWTLPGYLQDGQVVFVATPLEQTNFLSMLNDFWEVWNDCAVTQRPSDGQLFLLETLPGIQFRHRRHGQDDQAAFQSFRNTVENRHQSIPELRQALREAIGAENFRSEYIGLLRLIPATEIDRRASTFLGEGANGRVITATWQRPAGMLAATGITSTHLDVALKEVVTSPYRSGDAFIRELSNNYKALAGRNTGCIVFHGITKLKDMNASSPASRLFLVFEKATEGPFMTSLARQLSQVGARKGWDMIIDTLCGILAGLQTLHAHGVIHRDLHQNNVLMTHRTLPGLEKAGSISGSYWTLVTDIGEGKILSTPDTNAASMFVPSRSENANHFVAPEIRGSQYWSQKADIFSFGMLAGGVLDLWAALVPDKEHSLQGYSMRMPAILIDALTQSLKADPDSRIDTSTLTKMMNDLRSDLGPVEEAQESRMKWVYWDWRDALPANHTAAVQDASDRIAISARYLSPP